MKNKTIIPLLVSSLFVLSACGAKTVSYDKFIEKASDVPEHSYVAANVTLVGTNYNDGKSIELKANYDKPTDTFVLENTDLEYIAIGIILNQRAKDVVDVENQENPAYQNNEAEYYVSGGFKQIFTRSGETKINESMTTKQELACRIVFNKYGLLTSYYEETKLSTNGGEPVSSNINIVVSYS